MCSNPEFMMRSVHAIHGKPYIGRAEREAALNEKSRTAFDDSMAKVNLSRETQQYAPSPVEGALSGQVYGGKQEGAAKQSVEPVKGVVAGNAPLGGLFTPSAVSGGVGSGKVIR